MKLRIPGYAIRDRIAEGGFGVVWHAVDELTGGSVAIKVLHSELVGSHDIILRFKREADAIAQLRHPNVVELLRYGRLVDGRPYLVMEHLSGDNLATHLDRCGPMTAERITGVLEPLSDALAAAHRLGIVHRDLKASNVLLSDHDGVERVVLLDFGIAKLIEQSGEPITAVRQAVGSPVCISPEQIRGDEVDPRTDVYGLGALTFHMLTGTPPFEGDWVTVMDSHLFADRPLPSDRVDIITAFDDVVVRAMSLESDDRFTGALEFLDGWRQAVRDSPHGVSPPRARTATHMVIGCYVDVHVDAAALDDPDDEVIDDMASVFPMAAAYLEPRGYVVAYESGDSALFVIPCESADGTPHDIRATAVDQAVLLLERLQVRPSAHPLVRVNLFLHTADAEMLDSSVRGGAILDSTAWVVPHDGRAVLASADFCHGLELDDAPVRVAGEVYRVYEC